MTTLHSVYGLRVHANRPIPGLIALPGSPTGGIELEVQLGVKPLRATAAAMRQRAWYVSPYLDEKGEPALTVWQLEGGAGFRFIYTDGTEFEIDPPGTRIWVTWADPLTVEDAATYLLGPVLGFVLRLRGVTCLHASAVRLGDQAVVLVGAAGAGKSSTAAAFKRLGYPVLSDDVVPLLELGDSFLVPPAYPYLCLWPDAVHFLFGSSEVLPRLTPTWEKRCLGLSDQGDHLQQPAALLRAIYILGARTTDAAAPFVSHVSAPAAFLALIANSYANRLLDSSMRTQEFELLSRVVAHVPIRQATPHADPTRICEFCEAILEDLQVACRASEAFGRASREPEPSPYATSRNGRDPSRSRHTQS